MRDPCCTKWTFRLYSSLLCCWVLPLLTVAPAYFLLSYSDKDADYSEFELPACKDRASFYCLEGRTMASLLRAVAVWPPFLYTLIVSNGYLLLRAKRAHDQYIRARKRENAQRIRKDFLTKWESAAIREQRLAREQAIYDRKVGGSYREREGGACLSPCHKRDAYPYPYSSPLPLPTGGAGARPSAAAVPHHRVLRGRQSPVRCSLSEPRTLPH